MRPENFREKMSKNGKFCVYWVKRSLEWEADSAHSHLDYHSDVRNLIFVGIDPPIAIRTDVRGASIRPTRILEVVGKSTVTDHDNSLTKEIITAGQRK